MADFEAGAGDGGAGGDDGAGGAGGGAEQGGGAGAADLLLGAGAGAGGGAGGDGGAGGEKAAGEQGGGSDAFLALLSADGGDADNPSNRDWAKAAGLKDIDHAVKLLRDNQKALRSGGKIVVPGENATAEEVAAFRTGIGVPETVEGYEIKAPDGYKLLDNTPKLAALALEHGIPKAAFEGLAKGYIQMQLDEEAATQTRLNDEAADWGKEQGDKLDAQKAHINTAARALGIDGKQIGKLREALGPKFALDLMSKLGAGMAEDVLITGGGNRFGVTPAEAQAEIDKLKADPEFQKKVSVKGSAERARWDRLQAAIGAAADAAAKGA